MRGQEVLSIVLPVTRTIINTLARTSKSLKMLKDVVKELLGCTAVDAALRAAFIDLSDETRVDAGDGGEEAGDDDERVVKQQRHDAPGGRRISFEGGGGGGGGGMDDDAPPTWSRNMFTVKDLDLAKLGRQVGRAIAGGGDEPAGGAGGAAPAAAKPRFGALGKLGSVFGRDKAHDAGGDG